MNRPIQPKTQVVTRSNFNELLPRILAACDSANFIAIDCEMSGLWRERWLGGCEMDSLDSRWSRVRDSGLHMGLLQYGICTFEWSSESGAYIARPFSFHLLPKRGLLECTAHEAGEGGDTLFHTSTETLKFLLDNKFDFQAMVGGGLSYLSREGEARLRHVHRLSVMRASVKNSEGSTAAFRPPVGALAAPAEEAAVEEAPRRIIVDVPSQSTPGSSGEQAAAAGAPPQPSPNDIRITHPKDAEWFASMVASVDKWGVEVAEWASGRALEGGGGLTVDFFSSSFLQPG